MLIGSLAIAPRAESQCAPNQNAPLILLSEAIQNVVLGANDELTVEDGATVVFDATGSIDTDEGGSSVLKHYWYKNGPYQQNSPTWAVSFDLSDGSSQQIQLRIADDECPNEFVEQYNDIEVVPAGSLQQTGRQYYLTDHLGSVRVVIDGNGDLLSFVDYYPFGLEMPGRTSYSALPKENYTGYELDDESGLLYAGQRYHDSAIGRWLSVDPASAAIPGSSPYVYVLNNPIYFIDPDGQYPWPVHVRSFISTPTAGGGLFYGDGRGASFTGTSRVYSSFTVDPSARTVTQPVTRSDPTIFFGIRGLLRPFVDRGSPAGSNDNISFAGNAASFDFSHSGKDPITPQWATPKLNVHAGLSFSEDLENGVLSISGSFTGDVFPSTEAFITDQSGETKLFLGAQKESGGLHSLIGDNNKPLFNVNMQVQFDKDGKFTGVKQGKTTYSVDEWNAKVQTDFDK